MWTHYGDESRGVAVRSTVGTLAAARWRFPFSLSVDLFENPSIRSIKYIDEESAKRSRLEDLHAAFRKREEFSSERELRLLVTTRNSPAVPGFLLHTDLSRVIHYVVAGPKADYNAIQQLLTACKFPIERLQHSSLRPTAI